MTARQSLDQIESGLDGVTAGKWCQFHPHYCEEAIGTPFSDWDTSHDISAVKDGKRRRIASFKHADDAAHVDRCSPDAIREIAAYVRETEARATAAEATVAALREALEDILAPIAKAQRELEPGQRLNGSAYSILTSAENLREIARKALSTPEKET